jgi:hypothetical protein
MIPGVGQCFSQDFRTLAQRVAVAMDQLDYAPLPGGKSSHRTFHATRTLGGIQPQRFRHNPAPHFPRFRFFLFFVSAPKAQVSSTQECFKVGELEYPRSHRSAFRIELFSAQVNRKEDFLQNVFGFCRVVENAERQGKDLPEVPVKEQRETVRASQTHALNQRVVRRLLAMVMLRHASATF